MERRNLGDFTKIAYMSRIDSQKARFIGLPGESTFEKLLFAIDGIYSDHAIYHRADSATLEKLLFLIPVT